MVMNENVETIYGIVCKSLDSKFAGTDFWNNPKHTMKRRTALTVLKAYIDLAFSEEEGCGSISQMLFNKFIEADQEQRKDASYWLFKKASRAMWVMLGDDIVEEAIDGMMQIDYELMFRDSEENVD